MYVTMLLWTNTSKFWKGDLSGAGENYDSKRNHVALKRTEMLLAYAAVYRPVCIIDLGQIYYRPPQNSKCACSVMLSGVCPALTRLDDNLLCGRTAQCRHPAT